MNPLVIIYCDGACLNNPGPGGFAALLLTTQKGKECERMVVGGELLTTNNRMELQSAIAGFEALKRPCRVQVYSDSQYVVKGMTQWLDNWKKRDFKTSARKAVENQDLWKKLADVSATHQVSWHWVKGHAGHIHNERVDQAAQGEAFRMKNPL